MIVLDAASVTRLSDLWTWPGWTPLGVLFAAVAAGGAILAWTQGKHSQQIADERYQRDITPRLRVVFVHDLAAGREYEAQVLNAGGAAVTSLFLVHIRTVIAAGSTAAPSHGTARMPLTYRVHLPHADQEAPSPILIAALDVQGNLWDCGLGVPIRDLHAWWSSELSRMELPTMALEEAPDGLSFTIGAAVQD